MLLSILACVLLAGAPQAHAVSHLRRYLDWYKSNPRPAPAPIAPPPGVSTSPP